MSNGRASVEEEFFEPYLPPLSPAETKVLPPSAIQSRANHNHRVSAHAQKVTKQTQAALSGLSLNEFTDATGRQWAGLLRPAGTGVASIAQWQVSIDSNDKPTIASGSVLLDDPLSRTGATVTGYDPTTGWTAASAANDGEVVCFKLTMDVNADITAIELAVRDVTADGWYDVTASYISSMFVPIATISVSGGVTSVALQLITTLPVLEHVVIDTYNGFWTR